ncbi:alpha/beta hydrolase [Kitasatospora sp. NPDC085464]|uniref:alpha/beta hydrolase n=1 Tax=Kitasatospora sp. NPDC085464 TaxID=3364063 RepID=UPI0037C948AB
MPTPSPLAIPTRFEGAPDRVALVLPGVGYTPARPLLHFAGSVLQQQGWTVQEVWWEVPDDFGGFGPQERIAWVEREVARAVDAEGGACRLLVGKSLASFACGLAADRGLAAAWLTPVLTFEPVARALHRTEAPTLLVGGGADRVWDRRIAESSGHEVLEVPGAGHGLELPDDAVGSIDILRHVTARLDRFVAALGTGR